MRLGRRGFGGICAAAAWSMAGGIRPAFALDPATGDTDFVIMREGEVIGTYSGRIEEQAQGYLVRTEVAIQVKFLGITAFRFHQQAEDVWRDGILINSDVVTNDDGTIVNFRGWIEDGRFVTTGSHGKAELTPGAMTDLCFWNEAILDGSQIIDTSTGEVNPFSRSSGENDTLDLRGEATPVTRYPVSIGPKSGFIWYDKSGQWVRAIMQTRDSELHYIMPS